MTAASGRDAAPIEIVAAVICDTAGKVLVVRKQGSDTFIQQGGKPEPGEAPRVALARASCTKNPACVWMPPARCCWAFQGSPWQR